MTAISTYSLAPVKGELKAHDLIHLLRRCLFGVGHKELSRFKGKEINACIDILLRQSPTPPLPVQEDSDIPDPLVPRYKVWVNAPYENDLIENRRQLFLKMWWLGKIINRDCSLTEKMTLFWHNHFVTEMDVVKDSRYSYQYAAMLRTHALGNFKKLIKEGTNNIAMLVYLGGNLNTKDAPNENYGRELFELFTLGKGNGVNYTEDDVKAAARILSGFKDNKETIAVEFNPDLHDTGDKQFSAYFNHEIIKGKKGSLGATEIDELIEMIFKRRQAAEFVCRNLYRWFVFSHIDEQTEQQIIAPLADIYIANHFEIIPVLKKLLSSEHFFDPAFRGCIVKSPVDFLVGAMHQYGLVEARKLSANHESWLQFYFSTADLGMDIGNPPSVAGWPAYYQAPKFHQWWANSASLGLRSKIMNAFSTAKGMLFNGPNLSFDYPGFIRQFKDPADVNQLIEDCVDLLLAVDISTAAKNKLKIVLLSGQQSEHYWTEAWNNYIADQKNEMAGEVVEIRLRSFFKELMSLPEFQMM